MINITNPQDCCGCSACMAVCSHNAIEMKPDKLGFLYPKVNKELCVECGLCERVCAFNENYDKSLNLKQPLAYAARHKNIREIETSRSGAVFVALSDIILEEGGVVYGVGYVDHFRVVHKRATTKVERDEFKGSKYVQSDLRGIFRQVKNDLKNGLLVMFSGTPCQTAGLRSYVGKRLRQNLFLIDIVCHGVPSPYIWRDYLKYQEQKFNVTFTNINFRDKTRLGWSSHKESFHAKNFNKEFYHYSYLFVQNIMLRKSCEKCHYANLNRPSDITLGDFWGWQRVDKHFNEDNKGCSLVFCNTEKGIDLFNRIRQHLTLLSVKNLEHCMQHNLQNPTVMNINRDNFESDYFQYGFSYVGKKYGDFSLKYKLSLIISKIIGKIKKYF